MPSLVTLKYFRYFLVLLLSHTLGSCFWQSLITLSLWRSTINTLNIATGSVYSGFNNQVNTGARLTDRMAAKEE